MVTITQRRVVLAPIMLAFANSSGVPDFDDSISLLQTRAQYENRVADFALSEQDPEGGSELHYKTVDPQGILKERDEAAHDVAALEFLASFRPCASCNAEAIMVGGTGDGSYAMCEDLLGDVTAAYSYGIKGEDAWGADLSTRLNIPVHQFDCFDTRRPPCPSEGQCEFEFNEECVGQRFGDEDHDNGGGRRFATLREQMTARGHAESGNLVMKMDIESSEWEVFADPDNKDLLPRFSQIILEFHQIGSKELPQHEAMQNLMQNFVVMHIHENNCCGMFDKVPEYTIATIVEVTLVRRDLITEGQCDPDPAQAGTRNKQSLDDVQGAHLPGGTAPRFSALGN